MRFGDRSSGKHQPVHIANRIHLICQTKPLTKPKIQQRKYFKRFRIWFEEKDCPPESDPFRCSTANKSSTIRKEKQNKKLSIQVLEGLAEAMCQREHLQQTFF
jgi:hypothetical protein